MYAEHAKEDSVSAVAVTMDNNYLLTGDTSGNLKLWNLTEYHFKKSKSTDCVKVEWFIIAHRAVINAI